MQGLTTADIVRLHRPERLRHDCDPSALPRQAFDRRPAERCVKPFGGFPLEADDTWTWDGYDWTAMEPSGRPSARYDAGFAYDAAHHSVVMFGGSQFAFSIGDTWHWDGSDWIPADPGSSPPPRDTSMAFDVATGHMILFGGFDDYFQVFLGGHLDLVDRPVLGRLNLTCHCLLRLVALRPGCGLRTRSESVAQRASQQKEIP